MTEPVNLEGLPEKYFTVPPCEEIDYDAHSILMDQINFLNTIVTNLSSGSEIAFEDTYVIDQCSHMIETLLFQAGLIMKAGRK
ncbi:MAG: hypothetical protein KZQ83_06665 [gamma proteobacterium symbiont of Taylorina sp.]|nr:hypothetical protein [gamma proteobacterium symbiont of Taylorina sp.]